MTPQELISALRSCGPQTLSVILHFIADRLYQAELNSGASLHDVTDFKIFLEECAEVAKVRDFRDQTASGWREAPSRGVNPPCPRCGHVHQGDRECGEQIGGGRICRCEMEVPA
jgi:hypothetical protein